MKNKLQIKIEQTETPMLENILSVMHGTQKTAEDFLVWRTVCAVYIARNGAEQFDAFFDSLEGAA